MIRNKTIGPRNTLMNSDGPPFYSDVPLSYLDEYFDIKYLRCYLTSQSSVWGLDGIRCQYWIAAVIYFTGKLQRNI